MRESAVEAYFRQRVVAAGGMAVKLMPTTAGTPDRLVVLPGGHVHLVELKAPGGRVRPIQKIFHERALARGVVVPVLSSKKEVDQWLSQVERLSTGQ